MKKVLVKKICVVFLLSIIILTSVPVVPASASSLFGHSWITDTNLYFPSGGDGLLPDSFEGVELSALTSMEADVETLEQNLQDLVNNNAGAALLDHGENPVIAGALCNYIRVLRLNSEDINDLINAYNSAPGDIAYTTLMTSMQDGGYADAIAAARADLISICGVPVKNYYHISDQSLSAEPAYWTYRWLYDHLEDYGLLAYEVIVDPSTGSKIYVTYLAPDSSSFSYAYYSVTRRPEWARTFDNIDATIQGRVNDFALYTQYMLDNEVMEVKKGVEKSLSTLVVNTGTAMYNMLAKNGMDITTIIFGRVAAGGGHPVSINSFQFELQWKNYYGIIGSIVYSAMRAVMVFGIILAGMFLITKAAFANSARAKDQLKSNLAYAIIALVLLYIMPNLVDVMIYIKDVILSVLGQSLNSMGSGEQVRELTQQYYQIADSTHRFFDACMYLGFVILSIYFAVVYIAAACSMTIVFGFFPLFLLLSFKDRKLLSTWLNFVIGTLLIPVVDCTLLHMPVLASELHAPRILVIFVCFAIIPSRGVIRKLLGFGANTGSELLGIGALMMAGRAAGGIVRSAKNTISKVSNNAKQARSDRQNAKLEDKLGEIETSTEVGGSAGASAVSARRGVGGLEPLEKLNYNTDNERVVALERAQQADARRGGGHEVDLVNERIEADSNTVKRNAEITARNESVAQQQQDVEAAYARYANKDNFENPAIFANLSHEQKAELYRRRAMYNAGEAIGQGLGAVTLGTVGGTLGFAGGTMMGPSAMATMGLVGADIGAEVGELIGTEAGRGFGTLAGYTVQHGNTSVMPVSGGGPVPGGGSPSPTGSGAAIAVSPVNTVSSVPGTNYQYGTEVLSATNFDDLFGAMTSSHEVFGTKTSAGLIKSISQQVRYGYEHQDIGVLRNIRAYGSYAEGSPEQEQFLRDQIPSYVSTYLTKNIDDPQGFFDQDSQILTRNAIGNSQFDMDSQVATLKKAYARYWSLL